MRPKKEKQLLLPMVRRETVVSMPVEVEEACRVLLAQLMLEVLEAERRTDTGEKTND